MTSRTGNLMQTITLSIGGMSCGHCVASVRSALEAVPGVELEDVRIGTAVVHTAGDARAIAGAALAAVHDAGYDARTDVSPAPDTSAGAAPGCACCTNDTAAPPPALVTIGRG